MRAVLGVLPAYAPVTCTVEFSVFTLLVTPAIGDSVVFAEPLDCAVRPDSGNCTAGVVCCCCDCGTTCDMAGNAKTSGAASTTPRIQRKNIPLEFIAITHDSL